MDAKISLVDTNIIFLFFIEYSYLKYHRCIRIIIKIFIIKDELNVKSYL